MEGPIRQKAMGRLPSCIRKLDPPCPSVYVLLRLRKTEQHISGQLGISIEETIRAVEEVRHHLIRDGMLDLIEDPRMIPIHESGPGGTVFPMPDPGIGLEHRLILKEFIGFLRIAIGEIPRPQRLLLRLRFHNGLSAPQILRFLKRIGVSPVEGKTAAEVKEQEIYKALGSALTIVLQTIRCRYGKETGISLPGLKEILEEIEL